MKSVVVYFSQTGNTRKIAEAITEAIAGVTGQCDTVGLRETKIEDLAGYDLIGLGAPTFHYEEPENVKRFIRSMGPLRGKPCFVFSTHGGHPGDVLPSMALKLRRQGLMVIGGFNCDASDHMPHFTYPWFTFGHPDEIDLRQAADFGREMAERSQRMLRGEKVPLPRLRRLGKLMREHIRQTKINKPRSQGFEYRMTYDKQKCRYPRCRLCVANCPMSAIDLSADPVIFRKGCISCFFCEMICPTGAIEFDPKSVAAQRRVRIETIHSRGYPEFFEKAESALIENRSTLYRMLADRVEVGNLTQMYGENLSKRPRYVIRGRRGII